MHRSLDPVIFEMDVDGTEFRLPGIMGHRGAAGTAPENTLAGLETAAREGAAWVEVDVMLTGDNVPVLFHDDTLARTTGRDALMARTTLAVLRKLEAGSWFASGFTGAAIPILGEAIEAVQRLGLRLNIEIKPTKGRDVETATKVMYELAELWPLESPPPLISSFKADCLKIARDARPDWPRAFISLSVDRDWRQRLADLDCCAFHVYWKRLSQAQAKAIKKAGYALACFTVNEPTIAAKLRGWGVDCIITDYPGRLLTALEQDRAARTGGNSAV